MKARPPIGARVRLLNNVDDPGMAGRTGTVAAHHVDGIAFRVLLDEAGGWSYTCDPINVRLLAGEAAWLEEMRARRAKQATHLP